MTDSLIEKLKGYRCERDGIIYVPYAVVCDFIGDKSGRVLAAGYEIKETNVQRTKGRDNGEEI